MYSKILFNSKFSFLESTKTKVYALEDSLGVQRVKMKNWLTTYISFENSLGYNTFKTFSHFNSDNTN